MKKFLLLILSINFCFSQSVDKKEFTLDEYLGFVKKYHPLVRNANLEISAAQASLMVARGGFDPKIEVDFSKKEFKDKEYYSILNSSFKIPTWYGIELKAAFDNSEGIYMNPENTTPSAGLTSFGIKVPLGQGLLINQRMADLRKAKINIKLSQNQQQMESILVLYDACMAYFNWKRNSDENLLYKEYLETSKTRFEAIKRLIINGDKPVIDSIEAKISLQNRMLSLEESNMKLAKSKLDLSNYLWLDNNIPVELNDNLMPEKKLLNTIDKTLKTNDLTSTFDTQKHPKINSIQNKIDLLEVERKQYANMLLPKIDVSYNYLSDPNYVNNFKLQDNKIGLNFYFPLFLRKERGSLKLSKIKIQETKSILETEKWQLANKIAAQKTEINSYKRQIGIVSDLVLNTKKMLDAEERLFFVGESSLFLINSRENSLITSQLNQIAIENKWLVGNAELFKVLMEL